MLWIIITVLVQIATAVHVVRTGRNMLWILAILFFPIMGTLLYLIVEVLPGRTVNRRMRMARKSVDAKLFPERELKGAREAIEVTDSAANWIRLGDALSALDRSREAVDAYREALARIRGQDHGTETRLARELLEIGEHDEALALLQAMPEALGAQQDARTLLKARLFAAMDRPDEAREAFEASAEKGAGDAGRCHYAAFLIEQGDTARATEILTDIELRLKHMDRVQRAESAEMYDWAMRELQRLRG